MRIVRLTARGFKTYRDTLTVGPLDAGLNCVVGFNGSGKSSLFQAIAFVLSPGLGGLSSSAQFLHEGAAGKALSGFVELELENADKQFPIEAESVTLRRTLAGAQRNDEFSVNGKHVGRQEYLLLLQAAGLSGNKSNTLPYFYVEQGRISASVSDAERFSLLKEASGIDVYSAKRVESVELLKDTATKRERIEHLMKEIEGRCEELRQESRQLDGFQAAKRERDLAEFQAVSLERRQVDSAKARIVSELGEKRRLRAELEEELGELTEHESLLALADVDGLGGLGCGEEERAVAALEKQIAGLKAQLTETTDESARAESAAAEVAKLLLEMQQRRSCLLAELETDSAAQTASKLELHRAQNDSAELSSELQRLEAMSGESLEERKRQLELIVSSGVRRNELLQTELAAKEAELRELKTRGIVAALADVQKAEAVVQGIENAQGQRARRATELTASIRAKNNEVFTMKQRQFEVSRDLQSLEREFKEASGSVLRSSNFNTRDLLSRSDIKGVLGLFGDFLTIPSAYRTAVESSLKSVLYNVVISDDSVADLVATKLAGGKGRVTLTPTNRLGDESAAAADLDARLTSSGLNAKLVSAVVTPKQGSDVWVGKTIVKFLARTAVVDNIDTGVEVAKRFRIDAVTLDGDVVSKDLVVRGGDSQSTRKRVGVVKNWQLSLDLKVKISAKTAELKTVGDAVKQLELEVRELQVELGEAERTATGPGDRSDVEVAKLKLAEVRKELAALRDRETELEKFTLVNIRDVDLPKLTADLERARTELADVTQRLLSGSQGSVMPESERAEKMASLRARLDAVKASLVAAEQHGATLSKRIAGNRSELQHFVETRIAHLEELSVERKRGSRSLDARTEKLRGDIERIETWELPQALAAVELRKAPGVQSETPDTPTKDKETLESDLQAVRREIAALEGQLGGLEGDSARLGETLRGLPVGAEEMELTDDSDPATALRRLRAKIVEANAELNSAKYQYLNKRSVEQFERVNAERAQLAAKQTELTANYAAVSNLLENMTAKEAAIVRDAFQRVKTYFGKLFERLVEGGQAELELNLQDDVSLSGSINVSAEFPSGDSKSRGKRLHELSGGQRTMVGLCFLIALQKAQDHTHCCLILDEVDAALDANYRSAIADTLYEEAHRGVQILCTSFRPEFCSVATKHWLVSMPNGTTRVDPVDISTAMTLVNESSDEQANDVSVRE